MATIKDIAKMTGFSAMTVSRVINNPEVVKKETRDKIMAAVEEVGYTQNRVARSLIKGCTFNICVYIPSSLDATESFVAQTISSIGEQLGNLGYSLSLRRKLVIDDNFDGIIAAGLNIDDEDVFERCAKIKPAMLYGNSERFNNWVDVNNYGGIYKMTQYIIDKGHKKIAYIGMDFNAHYVMQRQQGFLDAMKSNGLEVPAEHIVIADNKEQAGFDACGELLSRAAPTAIVCATDLIAVGCMHALHHKGIKVPSQMAVSGFDGFGIENTVFPRLTTVRQPLYKVGIMLADAIVDSINGKPPRKGVYVEPDIKVGESV